jgi:hypothetical protein
MKSRRWKKLGIILLCLVALVMAAALVIPRLIDANQYRGLIAAQIEKATGGKVTLGRITWGVAEDIWIKVDEFSVAGATAFPGDLELHRIYAEVSMIPLLKKKVVIDLLLIEDFLLTFRLDPPPKGDRHSAKRVPTLGSGAGGGEKDAGSEKALTYDDKTPARSPLPVEIMIEELAVDKGKIILEDSLTRPGKKVVRIFSDVEIGATNLIPGEEMAFQFALRDAVKPGLGLLRTRGTFAGLTEALTLENPKLKIKGTISSLAMNVIKPYLKESPLAQRLGGTLSLEVNYDGDLGSNARAEGLIDLSKFTYTDPSMWERSLPVSETKIIYRVNLAHDDLRVEKITVKTGTLSLDVQAVVKGWRKDPIIRDAVLSCKLSLVDLIPLVPWKLLGKNADIIQDVLRGGGKVTIERAGLPEIDPGNLPANLEGWLSELEMRAQVSGISFRQSPKLPNLENISSKIKFQKGVAILEGLTGRLGQTRLPEITVKISNLPEMPRVDAHLGGRLDLGGITDEEVFKRLRDLGIEKLRGTAGLDLRLHLETHRPKDFQLRGKVELRNVQLGTSLTPLLLEGLNADLTFKPSAVEISKFFTKVVVPPIEGSPGGRFDLELNGHLGNWHHQPVVTLRGLRTSKISLPSLVPVIPWEKLGESSDIIRESFLAGGELTIENLAFSKLDLKKLPKEAKSFVPRIRGALSFSGIAFQPSPLLGRFEGITGRATLEKGVLSATGVQARIGPLTLPTMEFRATNLTGQLRVWAKAKGPLRVERTADADVKKLLMRYNLKSLSGKGEADLSVRYDQAKPVRLEASGSLVLGGFRAEAQPEGVLLDELRGRVLFNRKKTTEITVQNFSGRVNGALIRLEGRLSGGGTSHLVVNAKVRTEGLNLAHLAGFVYPLKKLEAQGMLDMDLDVYLPYTDPMKTRLQGMVKIRGLGFRLADQGVTVNEGDADLELAGNAVKVKNMTLIVNDQKLILTGRMTNPLEPDVQLHLKSPYLNLDRLLPPPRGEEDPPKTDKGEKKETPSKDKTLKRELPPLAHKLTARLKGEVEQVRYRGHIFQDLKLAVDYEHGVIKSYDLDLGMAGGRIRATGSADLRDPEGVLFSVEPNIEDVPIEQIVPLFGIDKYHLQGPLTMTGRLKGRVGGGSTELISSLEGNLEGVVSEGRLTQLGSRGELFGKIFTFLSLKSLLFVRLKEDLAGKGMPFKHIRTKASFKSGHMTIREARIESNAMNGVARGTLDLVNQKMDLKLEIQSLTLLDKVLGLIPLVGRVSGALTKVYLDVKGPLQDPRIRPTPTKNVTNPLKELFKAPERLFKRSEEKE